MKVEGCSNPGLSFTQKYKKAIINIFDFLHDDCTPGKYDYSVFQNLISSSISSDNSEIRMIIPFLIKLGVINHENIIKGGSRIREIIVNNSLFTLEGICFISFFKIELKIDNLSEEQQLIVKRIYAKFGVILFNYLLVSDDEIYRDLYSFLKKYETVDKNEFFILTDCRKKDRMGMLDNIINNYRSKIISPNDIEPISNINSFQYITSFLLQLNILKKNHDDTLSLSYLIKKMEGMTMQKDNSKVLTSILNDVNQLKTSLEKVNTNNNDTSGNGYNKIFYGIPGCGKSYKIDAMLNHKPEFVDEAIKNKIVKKADESDIIRTTFYLDYSNSDFIGQIYPCVEKVEVSNDDGSVDYKSIVTYKRIPGPFTKALLRAYQHLIDKDKSQVYLIIEEINRGNAAAIFGDTFQLLDRKNGDSEYPINNEFIESYLKENLDNIESLPSSYNLEKIMIPHNLTIFATMNTSDQNVFPLDTAFKRRWNRERITNDWGKVGHIKGMYIPYTDITWENFAKTINKEMISQSIKKDAPISEDKQMGAYFASEDMLTDGPMEKDDVKLSNFENNILDYLYNDVTKFDHSILFEKQLNSIDNIYERINLYIDAINETGAEQAESKCVFNKVFVDEITEQMLGFVTKADDSDD